MKSELLITIRQLNPDTGAAKDREEEYLWGIGFTPEFEVSGIEFHANTNFKMKGVMFTRVDVLELTGEGEDERMQVVISKSLIHRYQKQKDSHTFTLKPDGHVTRLGETLFINTAEIPEDLKKKLDSNT